MVMVVVMVVDLVLMMVLVVVMAVVMNVVNACGYGYGCVCWGDFGYDYVVMVMFVVKDITKLT